MDDISPRMRFAEEIRQLIHENFGPGYPSVNDHASVVNRRQVEAIGRSLGMTEGEACRNFLPVQNPVTSVVKLPQTKAHPTLRCVRLP
jgi:hypothetical protein